MKAKANRQVKQKWYKSKRWRQLRKAQLVRHPYCQCPHHIRDKVPAEVVDHIVPHRGDPKLMWDASNLQSMTKQCHDKYKQSQEKGGAGFDCGSAVDGTPLNQDHPWHQ